MATEKKVAATVAEAEFYRFIEAMDIDIDPKGMDDDDRKSLDEAKRKLIRAMLEGALVINEAGEPVYTPKLGEYRSEIVFPEPDGECIMVMDKKKKNHDVGKMFETMAQMTGVGVPVFRAMKNRDVKVCLAIVSLFLG